jgi:uncharacterized protein YdaU (DUF1376 family)
LNYYNRHLGDYARDCAHLSMLEHGAYTLLLDRYYSTEQGIAADQAHRVCRARTREERAAVDAVLSEFFTLTDGIWTSQRAEREIVKMRAKADAAAENGKLGGRPKRTQQEPNGNPLGFQKEPSENRTQSSPITNSQEPVSDVLRTSSSAPPTRRPTIPCPYADIVSAYHDALPDLPRVLMLDGATGDKRKKAMRTLWGFVLSSRRADGTPRASNADEALDWVRRYFARAAANDFLMGRTGRVGDHANWRCDFDFLLTDKGMRHVIEKTEVAA